MGELRDEKREEEAERRCFSGITGHRVISINYQTCRLAHGWKVDLPTQQPSSNMKCVRSEKCPTTDSAAALRGERGIFCITQHTHFAL